ncbi:hypothetical protein ABW19_dt0209267 [Dactylella cylindrospora]|nr:hypothetical protein ABW19_dt0209267 [Dactylella cylindrospora]
MRSFALPRIYRPVNSFTSPFPQSVHDPIYIRIHINLRYSDEIASTAPLMVNFCVIPILCIFTDKYCNLLALPSGPRSCATLIGTFESTHNVSFAKESAKRWIVAEVESDSRDLGDDQVMVLGVHRP